MLTTPNRKLQIPESRDTAVIVNALKASMEILDKWENPIRIPYVSSIESSVSNVKEALDNLFSRFEPIIKDYTEKIGSVSESITQVKQDLVSGVIKVKDASNADNASSADAVAWTKITDKPTTFAPSSHNHDTSEITSGVLGVARGGTGNANGTVAKLTTARTIAISGGATGTATSFDGSANITIPVTALDVSKATAGTLPVARGGTGQTTLALARNAMGLGNTTGALPVANGGTGATAAATACTNLGAVKKSGDTMTGELVINTVNATTGKSTPLRFKSKSSNYAPFTVYSNVDASNPTYGDGLGITMAGITVIGGGESSTGLLDELYNAGTSMNTEVLYCVSDTLIYFCTNCQTVANRVTGQIDKTGKMTMKNGYATSSDMRDKEDIKNIEYPYEKFIRGLRPVTYVYDMRSSYKLTEQTPVEMVVKDGSRKGTRRHNGFIAQEVKELADKLGFDFAGYVDNKIKGGEDQLELMYMEFISPMVKCIQDLYQRIEMLEKKMDS